jgi:hypothetical protein
MNKKIEFNYEGKDYTLEYDRKAIQLMEGNGLEITKIEDKPYSSIQILWQGAFLKNHKNEKTETIEEIYKRIPNKSELNKGVISMFNETYYSLIGDSEGEDNSKNIEWKMA